MSTGIVVTIRGLPELSAALQRSIAEPKHNLLMRWATATVAQAQERAPVDRGYLRNSLAQPEIMENRATVGSALIYANPMEYGSTPHWAPFDAILAWVRRKGLAGSFSVVSHQRVGGMALRADQDMRAARAIWLSIAKRGTRPHPFLAPAAAAADARLPEFIEQFKADLREALKP